MTHANADARFWAKVRICPPGACWIWMGAKDPEGYGYFGRGPNRRVHRWSYERFIGPIPEGLVIDHLCRVPSCVNPDHLEPVTTRENVLRGIGFTADQARRTHCPKGHEYTPENTYPQITRGKWRGRGCRICQLEWGRNSKRRLRAAARARRESIDM